MVIVCGDGDSVMVMVCCDDVMVITYSNPGILQHLSSCKTINRCYCQHTTDEFFSCGNINLAPNICSLSPVISLTSSADTDPLNFRE